MAFARTILIAACFQLADAARHDATKRASLDTEGHCDLDCSNVCFVTGGSCHRKFVTVARCDKSAQVELRDFCSSRCVPLSSGEIDWGRCKDKTDIEEALDASTAAEDTAEANLTSPGSSQQKKKAVDDDALVKLVVYDFDKTISEAHVYSELREACGRGVCSKHDLNAISIVSWANFFGGSERIADLKKHFDVLKKRGVHIYIASFGYQAEIEMALQKVGLAEYVERITGVDSCDGCPAVFGSGGQNADKTPSCKASWNGGWGYHKWQQIMIWASDLGLENSKVLFVDDSDPNTRAAVDTEAAHGMSVKLGKGLKRSGLKFIENAITGSYWKSGTCCQYMQIVR